MTNCRKRGPSVSGRKIASAVFSVLLSMSASTGQDLADYSFGTPLSEGRFNASAPDVHAMMKYGDQAGADVSWYDSGARYQTVHGIFTSPDPLAEDCPHLSPYVYCADNPVNLIDPDGKKVVFVNGFLGFGSSNGGFIYWGGKDSSFIRGAQSAFKDYTVPFCTNYDFQYWQSSSRDREILGYNYARDNYQDLIKGMTRGVDKFNFVSHSMGGSFSEGMIRYLAEQGWETENAVFLNAWEPTRISSKKENTRIDATCTNDPVQFLSIPISGNRDIPSSDSRIRIKSREPMKYIHKDLICGRSEELWNHIKSFLSK